MGTRDDRHSHRQPHELKGKFRQFLRGPGADAGSHARVEHYRILGSLISFSILSPIHMQQGGFSLVLAMRLAGICGPWPPLNDRVS